MKRRTAKDILKKARELITKHGLAKRTFGNCENGFCLDGALRAAASRPKPTSYGLYWKAVNAVCEALGVDRINSSGMVALWDWNDAPRRTKRQVIALLDKAIASC